MDYASLRTSLRFTLEAWHSSKWTIATGIFSSALLATWLNSRFRASTKRLKNAASSDPSLIAKHTTYESYTTPSGFTYPRIRTFFKKHQQSSKLPKNLPLLVFIHGLGGSASQFEPLLTSLINVASCLAIDLPGCGLSDFRPNDRHAYSTHAFAELLASAISQFRDAEDDQKVVLIGHSMGCSIASLLASSTSPLHHLLEDQIIGMIAICPQGQAPNASKAAAMRRFSWTPLPLFDLFRWYDRRGGMYSHSVERMVGKDADRRTRRLQLTYNEQSQSAVFLRMIGSAGGSHGLPGKQIWAGVKVPLFLIAGEADQVTPPAEVEQITEWLTDPSDPNHTEHEEAISTQKSKFLETGETAVAKTSVKAADSDLETPRTDSGHAIQEGHTSTKHSFALKTTIFPKPSGHGLMYTSSTVRILAGMIESFLSNHMDERLGAAWQLQHLTTSGKWDVKNLTKWQSIENCSEPIASLFRAMKTMREVDDIHSPKEFVKHYSHAVIPDGVQIVIDISHETPVYHPKGLQDAGVEYYKFPTVSKETPKPEEVERFIALVDTTRESHDTIPPATIGVHCHYGFNRTGFLIICYLVERMGYRLQDALDEFARTRAPGIRHQHFENELFVRYAVKMERRGTVIQ